MTGFEIVLKISKADSSILFGGAASPELWTEIEKTRRKLISGFEDDLDGNKRDFFRSNQVPLFVIKVVELLAPLDIDVPGGEAALSAIDYELAIAKARVAAEVVGLIFEDDNLSKDLYEIFPEKLEVAVNPIFDQTISISYSINFFQ